MKIKFIAAILTAASIFFAMPAFAENEDTAADADTAVTAETTETTETTEPAEATAADDTETEAAAEPTAEPTEEPAADVTEITQTVYVSSSLDFRVVIGYRKYVVDSFMEIEVYNSSGELVGTDRQWVGGNTDEVFFHYDVPEYVLGEVFTVKLVDGARSLAYYDSTIQPGGTFTVTTGFYFDADGSPIASNLFTFDAVPNWEKEVVVYVDGEQLSLSPRARIVDGYTLVPVRAVAEAMHLNVYYDGRYDSVTCSIGDSSVIFNLGMAYATVLGQDTYLPHSAVYIDGSAYVPVRPLAEAFEASIDTADYGDHLDVIIGESATVRDFMNQSPVNQWGISSSTPYLIWVSKSEYTVRVYTGSQYNWVLAYTAPCAIGAPDTPTITGSFEYIEKTEWDYDEYYVGPVLRFYNGYALHSTLLYYGGGEYDGRVGVQISHGCVRLHPEDINWIADRVPFGTRIYITE